MGPILFHTLCPRPVGAMPIRRLVRPSAVGVMVCRRGCCFLLLAWLVSCSEVVSGKRPSPWPHTPVAAATASTGSSGQAHPRRVDPET